TVRPALRGVLMPRARSQRPLFAAVSLLILSIAPLALAQGAMKAKKKKSAKPAATAPAASASASASSSDTDAAPPSDAPPKEAADTSTPDVHAAAAADSGDAVAATDVPDPNDDTNTAEDPNRRYYFIGARYRGTIVPAFIEHLFVNEGATVYSNTIGAEVDMRKGGQSMIAWIQYTEYTFDNTLFWQKGTPDLPQNYSIVNSGLKSVYVGLDEVWSTPIAKHLDFEYGFGIGIGAIFGDLINNWVRSVPNANFVGAVQGSNGQYYAPCQSQGDAPSCQTNLHPNASVAKVGNYVEPSWFGGGSVPVIFPHIAIPQLGLRYKPVKEFEARLNIGFSLTGFFFGLSGDYGLENTSHSEPQPVRASTPPVPEHTTHTEENSDTSRSALGRELF
ncbi:MAG: hypothetical protein ACREJ3_03080, partial [Polyangiaceae bacterium]